MYCWKITKALLRMRLRLVDGKHKLLGIFTDGDLRRHLEEWILVVLEP